ncbi:MFS transporter [Helicobacter cappadocius]|uniref:MFS transporter n=1 Tax=Helicobacter cappadocius TaxID=3063998 RepID=A0AA90PLA5_9HELI|nr:MULTISPECIES: MFS transporter [unclassified Helicobacter]MDO7253637.1 MFS transporter [Helicobacter sp. faydin-H75]MDP2539565.1 MFS transporter [Helicobacter sp. faydin-H76]
MIKATLPLTGIAILRFLGLFIVLPVISLYASSFPNATPLMLGLAVGGAYLTQVIFQTPIGIASDRYDRKKVVMIGLFVFMVGSIICALAHNIELLIIGRLIQGAGAVGGVVSAQVSDLVREESRTKAMAIMGGGIFASFTIAMIVGPIIGAQFGVDYLFAITAFLTLCSMILLYTKVPDTPKITYSFEGIPKWKDSLVDRNLWIINLSSFLEKTFMTLIFVIIPLVLVKEFGFAEENLWKIYAPGAILGVLAMGPASIIAEKYGKAKVVMLYGVLLFLVAYACIAISDSNTSSPKIALFITGIMVFFIGFASLEPIMQSLASKYAKAHQRGAALGMFTTYGYIGSCIGGMAGGVLYHYAGIAKIGIIITCVCVVWIVMIIFLKNPAKQKNVYLPLEDYEKAKFKDLDGVQGIIEWYVNESEKIIIVKYDVSFMSEAEIMQSVQKFKK